MGESRAVLDHQDPLALDDRRIGQHRRRVGLHHHRLGIHLGDVRLDGGDAFLGGAVHLVDHDHVGTPEIHLAGEVAQLVSGAMRVDHGHLEIGLDEGKVVVAPIPHDDVTPRGIVLGSAQNGLVIVTRVDDVASHDVRLVLLHLLDGAIVLLEIGDLGEPLHLLGKEVPVRHGMADRHHPEA